jgi:ABC-2 type transport system ATP-binding protein
VNSTAGVVLNNVSKFYGDVLGVNRVCLEIGSGITGLVGPNGAGKSTLMNIITGLIRPDQGSVTVHGLTPADPARFYREIGYCSQYDAFPAGQTGREFVRRTLAIHGYSPRQSSAMADSAIESVGLFDKADDRIERYSKGMRQRIKLAQAICHEPDVLILDEPLNGLDPMARAQVIALFHQIAEQGAHVIVSSHVLHEVDLISDHLVLINNGYLVAEGDVAGIQSETGEPLRVFLRSQQAREIASKLFDLQHVIEVQLHQDRQGLFVRTSNADDFFLAFNRLVLAEGWTIEVISPADESLDAVYQQLIVVEQSA